MRTIGHLLFILGMVLLLTGCFSKNRPMHSDLENLLASEIQAIGSEKTESLLRIEDIIKFQWDRLYIFTPYTSLETIDNNLGFHWKDATKTNIDSRDDINLLVFVLDGKVVQYVEFPRQNGDFSTISEPNGFTPQNALFEVDSDLRICVVEE